jgi:hypothetical protein
MKIFKRHKDYYIPPMKKSDISKSSGDGLEVLSGGGNQGIIDVKNLPDSTIIKTVKVNF